MAATTITTTTTTKEGTKLEWILTEDESTILDVQTEVSGYFRLDSCDFPEGVTRIGYTISSKGTLKGAFEGIKGMVYCAIPERITEIGPRAFAWCESLREVVFPYSLETVGTAAFAGCTNICAAVFPKATEVIADGAFANCDSLKTVVFENIAVDILDALCDHSIAVYKG